MAEKQRAEKQTVQRRTGEDRELLIFSNMHMIHVYMPIFNGNPNFAVTRMTKAISRVQVNNVNGNPRDQDRE